MTVSYVRLIPTIEIKVSNDYHGKPYYTSKKFKTAKGAAEFWAFHVASDRTEFLRERGRFNTYEAEDSYFRKAEGKLIRRSLPVFARLLATS